MILGYIIRKLLHAPRDLVELTDMAHHDGNGKAIMVFRIDQGVLMTDMNTPSVQAWIRISSGNYTFRSNYRPESGGLKSAQEGALNFLRDYERNLRLLFNEVEVYNQRRCPEMNV